MCSYLVRFILYIYIYVATYEYVRIIKYIQLNVNCHQDCVLLTVDVIADSKNFLNESSSRSLSVSVYIYTRALKNFEFKKGSRDRHKSKETSS